MSKIFTVSVFLSAAVLLLPALPCRAVQKDGAGVSFESMKLERLPDLGIPRAVHRAFLAAGEIVVVGGSESGTEAGLYLAENGHYRLQPENDTMEPIILEEVEILGKVITVIRRNNL